LRREGKKVGENKKKRAKKGGNKTPLGKTGEKRSCREKFQVGVRDVCKKAGN